MELMIGLIVGFLGGFVAIVVMLRRANANPSGITAKMVQILGGGGGPKPVR